ncbi:hypothetical protein E2C01_000119 [Portunus trituberculatus]|uniref:Uncharacterized protein n=1 Tax=Portunus trituberculatus TaxID=210409 RepID=A0A5B7CGF6_PORTR|nr:hypothetical protein [Portunus trituberculatus]
MTDGCRVSRLQIGIIPHLLAVLFVSSDCSFRYSANSATSTITTSTIIPSTNITMPSYPHHHHYEN